MPDQLYATPPIRWSRYRWLTMIGPTPWMRYLLNRGPIGEHARWLTSPDRPESMRRQVMGTERWGPPWPIGFTMTRGVTFRWIDVDPISQLAGWLLTLYAVVHFIRRR